METLWRILGSPYDPWAFITHAVAAAVFIVAMKRLVQSRHSQYKAALLVYASGPIVAYGGSAIFHHGLWFAQDGGVVLLQRLDHCGVLWHIAATQLFVYRVPLRKMRFASHMAGAVFGIFVLMALMKLSGGLLGNVTAGLSALLLGVIPAGIAAIPLARRADWRAVWLMALGGGLYVLGAALYIAEWPQVIPGFGPHETMHVIMAVASYSHYIAVRDHFIMMSRSERRLAASQRFSWPWSFACR